ncbi:hypothetical protein OG762_09325 [Streptomyces sp. NBC_01136]|uniref:hypothetical protein n=1 Tax=unclassified Streptomyces TaxID=2593676 RepID=UPI003249B441|nr:hypothetical protein OG762_09325 [Streptomyces sp. NBC_01136]
MVLGSDLRRGNGQGVAAVAVLVLAAALTACSDSTGGGSSTPVPTPSVEQSSSAPPSPTGPADPAAAEKQVKQNWEKFFSPSVPVKDKLNYLENGDRMTAVVQGFSGDKRGRQVAAQVQKVVFTSPTEAEVTYALTLKGATALPNAAGTAVDQGGTWKVSDSTLCALVALSGDGSTTPAGC